MSESESTPGASSRLHPLDALRGFCILNMMWQYIGHAVAISTQAPVNSLAVVLLQVQTPVVTQIFLTLAAFNLAARGRQTFVERFPGKLRAYFVLFVVFSFELFVVGIESGCPPPLSYAVEFNAIMCWMVCLALIATCYRFLPFGACVVLFFASWLLWALPLDAFAVGVEAQVSAWLGVPFSYDMRPELFITSGLLGLLLGHFYYHRRDRHAQLYPVLVGLGLFAYVSWLVVGEPFTINPLNLYATEHDVILHFDGALGLWGLQALVILLALWPTRFGHNYRVPWLNWLGVNSLLVYALHKLLAGRIIVPLVPEFCRRFGFAAVPNGFELALVCSLLIFGAVYLLKKYFLARLIAHRDS